MGRVTEFEIKKLHGYKDFMLRIQDNTLILVGENGSGKTTVLRLLYYLLSGQWSALSKFKFNELMVRIDDKAISLPYALLEANLQKIDPRMLQHLPMFLRRKVRELQEEGDGLLTVSDLQSLVDRYDVPARYLMADLDLFGQSREGQSEELKKLWARISESLNAQLLYLPTYRRIEQELNLIFKGMSEEELRDRGEFTVTRNKQHTFVELIEFGMRDVERAIKSALEELKEFARTRLDQLTLGYLGDVVDQKYAQVNVDQIREASDETIANVLNRIGESILPQRSKEHLSQTIQDVKSGQAPNEHKKVICHYFIKLLGFQQELETKEHSITKFCEVCNEYLVDKVLKYDSPTFSFAINAPCPDGEVREVELRQLSSGEKQIVSLFSHLYLSGDQEYFVLIDEPELSLSVTWQRRFLADIRDGGFCSGLVAVTHSPFIYDNDLKPYAYGLGEFSY